MSHELNDEQWAALVEFYEKWPRSSGGRMTACEALYVAIAPLMKPWRVEELPYSDRPRWGLMRMRSCYSSDEIARFYQEGDARRICDLLNESEGRR